MQEGIAKPEEFLKRQKKDRLAPAKHGREPIK